MRPVTDQYEWILGLRASYQPVSVDGQARERVTGVIVEVRDDSPWPDEEHCRIVIDADGRLHDVAKERVDLE